MRFEGYRISGELLTMEDPSSSDLLSYAAGRGHRDYPCLSRAHNPTSCVPCIDFSPWLRERVRRGEPDAVGEYLWRVRRADPDVSGSSEQILRKYLDQAYSIMATPLDRHLDRGSIDGYTDLRVALVLLAAHETFSGFIMAGESADFMAAVMVPHSFSLTGIMELVERRNAFVADMARDMEYWACWAPLSPDALRSPIPPHDTSFQAMLSVLAKLPLVTRAHAVDALRHLAADPSTPRPLAGLCRNETKRSGIDLADSSRLIIDSGLVVPASDIDGWLQAWTRRDLLTFLNQVGVRAPKSWSKERLAEIAKADCEPVVRSRMEEYGAVELAPAHAEAAGRLAAYIDDVKETWRVWLGFGTGVRRVLRRSEERQENSEPQEKEPHQ
ncbi:MAG TPA: hypothetical protein VD930_01940 [Gemmatimonadales bacterium]|nr:hypothetical protein [Gemmatimonadales bacterium]